MYINNYTLSSDKLSDKDMLRQMRSNHQNV